MSFWLKWFNSLFTFVLHTKRARYLIVIARFSCLSNLNAKQEKNEWSCGCNAYTCTYIHKLTVTPLPCVFYPSNEKKNAQRHIDRKRSHPREKKNRIRREKLVIKKSRWKVLGIHIKRRTSSAQNSMHACNDSLRTMLSSFGHTTKCLSTFVKSLINTSIVPRNQTQPSVLW